MLEDPAAGALEGRRQAGEVACGVQLDLVVEAEGGGRGDSDFCGVDQMRGEAER
ncbi:hypothetical protein GCM10022235_75300 [Kribbella ginsengisoli]|uniref:Uncharacterized protein n=1 Tax=Kribbella ginsengisoli TaxID=363865 RepID=A0ABP6YZJ7_9ACTN